MTRVEGGGRVMVVRLKVCGMTEVCISKWYQTLNGITANVDGSISVSFIDRGRRPTFPDSVDMRRTMFCTLKIGDELPPGAWDFLGSVTAYRDDHLHVFVKV